MKLLRWLTVASVVLFSSASLGQPNDSPISASRFGISIDGVSVSVQAFAGGDEPGEKSKASSTPLSIVVDQTGSDAMWQWIATSINDGPVPKTIEGQAKGKRRATFTGAMITEVKFDDLDAANNKSQMKVTVTVAPKTVAPAADAVKGNLGMKQKSWNPSNFRVKIGGLPVAKVTKIDAFTFKQSVKKSGQPVLEPGNLRITLDAADAKAVADALAKDKSAPLTISLTGDGGGVWKTITVTGLKIESTQAAGASKTMVLKGSKILMN